ncbi:hypothetical protein [Carnobacterium sp. ISL-102]
MTNPVLRGFNADPSIIRVEDTYYIFAEECRTVYTS